MPWVLRLAEGVLVYPDGHTKVPASSGSKDLRNRADAADQPGGPIPPGPYRLESGVPKHPHLGRDVVPVTGLDLAVTQRTGFYILSSRTKLMEARKTWPASPGSIYIADDATRRALVSSRERQLKVEK